MHRNYAITSFERVRVAGAYDVRLITGKAPAAAVDADAATLDTLVISVEGTTLTLHRAIPDAGETPRAAKTVPVVVLATPLLRSATVTGGGKLSITGMKTQRADLAVNGAGALAVQGINADQLNATVIGAGGIRLAGRALRAQLLTNGAGTIEASVLDVNDLTVRLDGPGATRAAARYTATITNTGLGQVDVSGNPHCTVKAQVGGPVNCGKGSDQRQ